MSEIDWSKAPEGATHYWAENDTFYTERNGKFYYADGRYSGQVNSSSEWIGKLAKRPSTAWSGEGLPPVGTVCQWFSPIYGWLGGKVVGHDGTLTVIAHNDGYTGCHPHEVRPIRTPEQIAADEREAMIEHMLRTYLDGAKDHRGGIRALYDAGYRKP